MKDLSNIVYEAMPEFCRIARQTSSVKWEQESHFAVQALQKNIRLSECLPHTIQNALVNVAAVGLTLNPADGYAYLVPEYNKELKQKECQLRISFKGLTKVATDTGAISWVKAEVVKKNDTFEYRGIAEMPVHNMNPFSDRGETIGVYCVAKTPSGEYLVDAIDMDGLSKIRSCAKTDMVWAQWFDEMAKKAVIKRAAKQWPKTNASSTLHAAIDVINKTEGSDFDEFQKLEDTANYIIDHIVKDDQYAVGEAWVETTDKEKEYLWKAKTKGGYFTKSEKDYIRDAIRAYHKSNEEPIEGESEEVKQTA